MENLANDVPPTGQDLPSVDPTLGAASGIAPGLTVAEVLRLSSLAGSEVLAGAAGLDRVVRRLNVMEVPDILPWVKPHELLLTTGYPLREDPRGLERLVRDFADAGLAAVGIKLGRYVESVPAEVLRAADEAGLPLLRLTDTVAFDDILNQVLTEVLHRQAAMLARSEEIHRILVNVILAGGDLDAITAELPALIEGGVMVTTPDGRVLAYSGIIEDLLDDPIYFEPTSGRFRVEEFKHGRHVLADPTARVAQAPIMAGSQDHGRVVLITSGRGVQADDVQVLERVAATAALVITRDLAIAAVEDKYQGDFLRDLITGRITDTTAAVQQCTSLGWDIHRPVVVVVAELDPTTAPALPAQGELRPTHERFAKAWSLVARDRDPKAAVAGYSQEVVVIFGADRDARGEETESPRVPGRQIRTMVGQVAGDGGGGRRSFCTGISRVVNDPTDIPAAYEQAKQAARVGRQVRGRGAVAEFDELGVYRLISQVPDSGELWTFMVETLGTLATNDDAETTDLRTTLEVLLDNNLNVAETARVLHFHYNTLRYRIGKLERMLGPFTRDPNLRLNLMVALRVVHMRGVRG